MCYRAVYLSLPPARQDLIQRIFILRFIRKEDIGQEPRLVPGWTMLVIGSEGEM